MPWAVKISLIAGAMLLLQSAWAFADGVRFLRLIRRSVNRPPGDYAPPAAVVIPCKGVDAGFEVNVQGFLHQEYPRFQVIFVVATTADPAYQNLRARLKGAPPGSLHQPPAALIVAGLAEGRGEKVNNLLRGIEAVDQAAEVLVFADIDATPTPRGCAPWWRRSPTPASPSAPASDGICRGRVCSRLRAAWDTSIATMMGEHGRNFAWGGSMAIRADDFRRLGMATKYWLSIVSDDYAMTRAVTKQGGSSLLCPGASWHRGRNQAWGNSFAGRTARSSLRGSMPPACGSWGWRHLHSTAALLRWAWRCWHCQTRPARRELAVAATLFVVLVLGRAKGLFALWSRGNFSPRKLAAAFPLLATLAGGSMVMLGNFVVAGFTRRIEWRGTEYELVSQDQVRVIGKSGGKSRSV